MSSAEEFLVNRGNELREGALAAMESLSSDIKQIDMEKIFDTNSDMGVMFFRGFEGMLQTLVSAKPMTMAGVIACDGQPTPLQLKVGDAGLDLSAEEPQEDEHTVLDSDMSFLDGIDLGDGIDFDLKPGEPEEDVGDVS